MAKAARRDSKETASSGGIGSAVVANRQAEALAALLTKIRSCRLCRDHPDGCVLPHEPRPVLQVSAGAAICVCGQAPGTRVHESGKPFTDPSGVRLRRWMGIGEDEFYDPARVAIVPMGFCFPGLDGNGADLPPRRECARTWHDALFRSLPKFDLLLLVGAYAQRWHLRAMGLPAPRTVVATVENWRAYAQGAKAGSSEDRQQIAQCVLPLPHPSWRNNSWIKAHPWFEAELVPFMQDQVRAALEQE